MSDYMSQGTFDVIWEGLVTAPEEEESPHQEVVLKNPMTGPTEPPKPTVREVSETEIRDFIGPDVDLEDFLTEWDPTAALLERTEQQIPKDNFLQLSMEEVRSKIVAEQNKNTMKKTLQDVAKFRRFLKSKGENSDIHLLTPESLDELLANFILSIRKIDGSEYEPTTIRNMVSSIDRHLKRHRYTVKIMQEGATNYFQLTRDALAAKQKSLKKMGKGNKPHAADPITDAEIDLLYERNILGMGSPKALINTLWINNCILLGLRGTTENYNMRWGDITINKGHDGTEFLQFKERQTKTRTGSDVTDIRKVRPKIWARPSDPERCPIKIFKLYASKRPANFNDDEHPFYLAPRTTPITCDEDKWFLKMRLGEKKLSSMLRNMCAEGGLNPSKNLTNHATRKHLVSKLRDSGVAPTDIMQISGHKNVQSILNYSTMSENRHREISKILSNTRSTQIPATVTSPESSTDNLTSTVIVSTSQSDQPSLHNVCVSNPTHPDVATVGSTNVNICNSSQDLTSLFSGATLNVTNLNVYMR